MCVFHPAIFENTTPYDCGIGVSPKLLLNFSIPRDYISATLSPSAIVTVTGRVYDYNMLCGLASQFGGYVRTHEKTDNTMRPRKVNAITHIKTHG